MKYTGKGLRETDKEAIWETFKLKQNIEDNPDKLDDRPVTLQALVNAKK